MTVTSLAASVLVALILGLALQPLVLRLMRAAAVIDDPNERSSHAVPTPRGGGLAVVVAAAGGLALYQPARVILVPLLLFAAIGLLEDVRGVPPLPRLGLQLVAGLVAGVVMLPDLPDLGEPVGGTLVVTGGAAVAVVGLIAFWLAGYANAFNFMDGINGLSAVHAGLAGSVYAVVGLLYGMPVLMIAGAVAAVAALAFLPWNGGRARIFLGDVGSYGLGGLLAATAAYGLLHGAPIEPVLAPLALYLADTGWTLARRCLRGEPWYRPHRGHAYQRLTDLGWSHQQVTAVTAVASAAVCACAVTTVQDQPAQRFVLVVLVLVALVAYLAAPTVLGTRPGAGFGAHPQAPERRLHARSLPTA